MRTIPWALFLSIAAVGCTAPTASSECVGAWERGPDDGERCEASIAPLLDGETGDLATELDPATPDRDRDVTLDRDPSADRGEGATPPTTTAARPPRDSVSGNATGRRAYKAVE